MQFIETYNNVPMTVTLTPTQENSTPEATTMNSIATQATTTPIKNTENTEADNNELPVIPGNTAQDDPPIQQHKEQINNSTVQAPQV